MDPFPNALAGSPLLDMLNVRYIIVPHSIPADRPDAAAIAAGRTVAYRDQEVVIYENAAAFDHAWIVHDVRADSGEEGLAQIASGAVDSRRVAFVDGELPSVSVPDPALAATELVTTTDYHDDELTATVTAAAPGLVVFSEMYADGWQATVDGQPVEISRTNEALRGVPVPAGEHTIELRYQPPDLTIGLWITGAAALASLAVFVWSIMDWLRRPERVPSRFRR